MGTTNKKNNNCIDCGKLIWSVSKRCASCANRITGTGRKKSKEEREKIGRARREEKGYQWKGDNVGYKGLHVWVRKYKEKSKFVIKKGKKLYECECCKNHLPIRRLDCANISGEYKRELEDYECLCKCCHAKRDNWGYKKENGIKNKFKELRRLKDGKCNIKSN